jgi:hypothetical protein
MSSWPLTQLERRRLAPPLSFPEPGAAAYGAAPLASRLPAASLRDGPAGRT